ncbi:MAG: YaiI/YqxD family protein [Myxococcota bacterium]|nr:YaiI/YqxD family protein [Myxococcota bacterium]
MRTMYIDADACSVKNECYKVANRWGWRVFVVANQYIQTPQNPMITAITVEQGDDVADAWIAERCEQGDVVVTNDIPLAALCLDKGARVLGQKGKEFSPDSIGDALASRELSQNLREMGIETGGPKPMQPKDRSAFLGKLDQILVALDREFAEGK